MLHLVDVVQPFFAAAFLRSESSKDISKCIQSMSTPVYVGPPDFFSPDQCSSYISNEMRQNLEAARVRLNEAPVENSGKLALSNGISPALRAAYRKINAQIPQNITYAKCLNMAVFSTNDTVGPDGLCPILFVFGVIPRRVPSIP